MCEVGELLVGQAVGGEQHHRSAIGLGVAAGSFGEDEKSVAELVDAEGVLAAGVRDPAPLIWSFVGRVAWYLVPAGRCAASARPSAASSADAWSCSVPVSATV